MLDDLLDDDGQAERHQDLVGMRPLVEMADQAALHGDADEQHDGNGEQDRRRHRIVVQQGAEIAEPGLDIGRADFERASPGRRLARDR